MQSRARDRPAGGLVGNSACDHDAAVKLDLDRDRADPGRVADRGFPHEIRLVVAGDGDHDVPLPLGHADDPKPPVFVGDRLELRVSTKSDPANRQLWTETPAIGRLVWASRTTPSINLPGFAVKVKSAP